MDRKGQAAIDYLSTYGWALLALSVAIGAIYLFVDLKPDTIVPETCSFGVEGAFYCVDGQIDRATNQVHISLRNTVGKQITIINMVCTHRESVRSEVFNRIIEPSEIFSLTCDMNDVDGPVVSFSKKAKIEITVVYKTESSIYPMSADGYLTTQPVN